MNRLFIIAAFCLLLKSVSAQNRDSGEIRTSVHQPGDIRLKYMPLGHMDPIDPSLNFGLGYVYEPRKTLELQAGIIHTFGLLYNHNEEHEGRGFFIRPLHRWYIGKREAGFLEVGLGFKHVINLSRGEWVWANVVDGVPSYERFMPVKYKRNVYMAEFRYGFSTPMGQSSPWEFEMWTGFGVRYRTLRPDLPDRYVLPDGAGDGWTGWQFSIMHQRRENLFMPHLNFGIAFTWLANRRPVLVID